MTDLLNYLGNCPVCNRRLRADRASVVKKIPDGLFVGVDCRSCWTSLALTIMINGVHFSHPRGGHRKAVLEAVGTTGANGMVTLIGMVTDLTANDLKKALSRSPFTLNDVLELHRYLKTQSTNFTKHK